MAGALPVRLTIFAAIRMSTNKISTVFSAPKYCDSTENKGAYINISPDYKLEYHKFDAVPHPPIRPMVCSESLFKLRIDLTFLLRHTRQPAFLA